MSRSLRIAYAVNRFHPSSGGVETHVERLSRELVAAGHQVTILTHDHWGDQPVHDVLDGIEIRRFGLPVKSQHLAISPALGRHLAKSSDPYDSAPYDLVHAHSYHDSPAIFAAELWDGPFVFTPHFHGNSESWVRNLIHKPYRLVGKRIVNRADRVICVSGAESDLVARTFPDALGKIDVISNGVDVDRLRAAERSPEPDGRKLLLVAGRLDHYKQVDRIVSAMPHLKDDYVLKITGDGPAREQLQELIARHGLEADVHLLGRVPTDTLASLFRTASCLVSMSTHEAQGIVLLEALAAGTRVLASAIPAHVDVGRQAGGSVALAPVDAHPHTLATMVRDVCADERPDVFIPSWPEVAMQTAMLYERLLGTEATPRPAKRTTRRSPLAFLRN